MPIANPHPAPARLTVIIFTLALAVAACGSSGQPDGAGPGGGPLLAYAQCMRGNGVPDFPDPSAAGGLVIPNTINPQAPAFRSAQRSCVKFAQPGGGRDSTSAESRKVQLLTLARCMRSHGVPGFADPTGSPPPPNGGNAIGGNGSYLALGAPRVTRSPAYRRAAGACRLSFP